MIGENTEMVCVTLRAVLRLLLPQATPVSYVPSFSGGHVTVPASIQIPLQGPEAV